MTVVPTLMGGISNNLFQICTAISYSLKHGCEYAIPVKIQHPHYPLQQVFYSNKINYIYEDIGKQNGTITTYFEPHFHYKEIPKFGCDYLILTGYFQSQLYFQEYREQILELLGIPYNFKQGWTFLHYRLGDYKMLTNCHEILSEEYIETSMEYFIIRGFRKFLIFSDEPELAKQVISYPVKWHNVTLEYSEGKTELEDLSLMASCQNGIMSASSFSWFGAWLGKNENRLITYPKKWFAEKLSYNDTKDLCPSNWIKI